MAHVLALDIATQTGWARWTGEMCLPEFGVQAFGSIRAAAFDALDRWMRQLLGRHEITEVVVEAPFYAHGKTRFDTARKTLGLVGTVERVCYGAGLPIQEVTAGQWRKKFFGRANAPKEVPRNKRRAWLKDAAMQECKRRGWDAESDDAADALGLLSYHCGL